MQLKVKKSCHHRNAIFTAFLSVLHPVIHIYTDGSCNPDFAIGGWASLIIIDNEKVMLSGHEEATTHQRMELTAAIRALAYVIKNSDPATPVHVFADSQYVVDLARRKEKLVANDFTTRKQSTIRNSDLVKELLSFDDQLNIQFIKVKAHQKKTERENDFNAQADQLSRKIVREAVTLLCDGKN